MNEAALESTVLKPHLRRKTYKGFQNHMQICEQHDMKMKNKPLMETRRAQNGSARERASKIALHAWAPPPPPLAPSCANRARDNFDFEAPSTNAKEVAVYACEPLKDHWRIIAWDFKLLIPIPPLLRNSWFDSKYVWGVAQPFAKLLHEIIIRKRNVMAHHQMLSPSRAHQANLARNPNY